ncbi:hypothetical protein [Ileibacterium valens]|uniref:Phage tail protein n=1 Tax=Ileibacterium valens TaxID=1862668 RepID=A0A1U7NHK7_9FIRM|nr:hypothetical protein [Ileibacterium valens]OLU39741.1 hypothetical protein BO224_06850 [Erysipelotrichaceae bacterium NYU-BL-E8]OLU39981.1 hypothetical protein BM735_06460 [Erysipelotrichaceae bacterium NYU-BL-F16]OLU41308.1 hypothetical protein BO222_03550 [Ileibacterium valens]
MTKIAWDETGKRLYETGVKNVVLYKPGENGNYSKGVGWNGCTAVNESPSGAEATPFYANGIKYLNLMSNEDFGGTIEAYTYPDEFAECDGSTVLADGVTIDQQSRKVFGLAYRTEIGNDLVGTEYGYKIHLVYGALASPSEKSHSTVNESPEAVTFSWTFTTTPVNVTGAKPTSHLVVDSTKVDPTKLAALEAKLYGSETEEPSMPLPDEVKALIGATA